MTTPLAGLTIGVTADRRADEQIHLLEGRGATCLHGPVIKTHPVDADDEIRAATAEVIANPPDIVVFTTGIGVRSWLEAADAVQLGPQLNAAISTSVLIARGPKAKGALVTAGFDIAGAAPAPSYDDVVAILRDHRVEGQRVAVQLDGAGAVELCERIEGLGAFVTRIPVYRWSLPSDTGPAERLIRAVVDRRVEAVTFTARPAVDNFFDIASQLDLLDELDAALHDGVATVCVGQVCATGFIDHGYPDPIVPTRHRLGAMVKTLCDRFASEHRTIILAGRRVTVQGRLVNVDGASSVQLSDRERAVFYALLDRPGAVISKRELLRRAWRGDENDEHLVEVTIGRLRQRLGSAGAGIETVLRRGYRADVAT